MHVRSLDQEDSLKKEIQYSCLRMKLLVSTVILFLIFWGDTILYFQWQLYHFTPPSTLYKGSNISTSLPTLVLSFCSVVVILIGEKWYLIMVWFVLPSWLVTEKAMATHSSVLAWRIPGTEEPRRLRSLGSHRVRHDWSDLAAAAWLVMLSIFSCASDNCLSCFSLLLFCKSSLYILDTKLLGFPGGLESK